MKFGLINFRGKCSIFAERRRTGLFGIDDIPISHCSLHVSRWRLLTPFFLRSPPVSMQRKSTEAQKTNQPLFFADILQTTPKS